VPRPFIEPFLSDGGRSLEGRGLRPIGRASAEILERQAPPRRVGRAVRAGAAVDILDGMQVGMRGLLRLELLVQPSDQCLQFDLERNALRVGLLGEGVLKQLREREETMQARRLRHRHLIPGRVCLQTMFPLLESRMASTTFFLPMPQLRRRALNEAVFREVNERIAALGAAQGYERLELVCECASIGCAAPISILVSDYEQARSDSRAFLVVTGHADPGTEVVLAERGSYALVQKLGETESRAYG
jgi:hypothetical protein